MAGRNGGRPVHDHRLPQYRQLVGRVDQTHDHGLGAARREGVLRTRPVRVEDAVAVEVPGDRGAAPPSGSVAVALNVASCPTWGIAGSTFTVAVGGAAITVVAHASRRALRASVGTRHARISRGQAGRLK